MTRRHRNSPFDLGCTTTRLLAQVLLGLFLLVGVLGALDYSNSGRVLTSQQHVGAQHTS